MNRLFFVLLAQVLIPTMCYAQANFFKGYWITNTGDTIKGYVQVREREFNPQFLRFKKELSNEAQLITISESRGYGADLGDAYERNNVEMSMSRISGIITIGVDTLKQNATVFLRIIGKGKNVVLYSLTDEIKERFYVKESTDLVPIELSRQFFYNPKDETKLIIQSKYRNQLLMLMRKYSVDESEERKIEKVSYQKSDLLQMVNLINHEVGNKSQFPSSRFFVGAGLNTANMKYVGEEFLGKGDTRNERMMGPLFKGGVDFFANPAIGKLIFRIELAVLRTKVDVTKNTQKVQLAYLHHSFKQTSVVLTPQILQNIYNAPNTKVFVGLGAEFNLPFYSDNVMERNTFSGEEKSFQEFYIAMPVVAGVVLNKKIELALGYSFPRNITKRVSYALTMEKYKVGVSYYLGKR